MKEILLERFQEIFGDTEGAEVFFAPGRVNLIGEHTDYNGGHVFPCALTIGTYAAARVRDDRRLCLYSMNFEESGVLESNLDELEYREDAGWSNYPKGVIWALGEKGYHVERGFDIVFYGNIPNGAGLSSSASIEVLTGFLVSSLLGLSISNVDLALLGQFAENQFNGVNCGIMDQFAVAMGKEGQAVFLDTNTLDFEYVPVNLEGVKIVIANTNKKRGLEDSAYNERREECEQALADLQGGIGINTLGDLTEEQFEMVKQAIRDEDCRRRAKHAVYENQRTLRAVRALRDNDLAAFGKLMNESHCSLRDDYEVTGEELDALVEAAWEMEGVVGSRMTGAGFGGCTVSLVREDAVKDFTLKVGSIYKEKTGLTADFYIVEIGKGPARI